MNTEFVKLSGGFVSLLGSRKRNFDLTSYNFDDWYDGAYTTVQRNLGQIFKGGEYPVWKNKNYNNLKKDILDILKRLSPTGTISLADEIEKTAKRNGIPFGIVQKILCILIKYTVASYYSGNKDIANEFLWVKDEDFVKTLPVPVDGKVLKNLPEHGAKLDIKNSKYAPKINGLPWSKIDKKTWTEIQDEVMRTSNNLGMFPLWFEMKYLWK